MQFQINKYWRLNIKYNSVDYYEQLYANRKA